MGVKLLDTRDENGLYTAKTAVVLINKLDGKPPKKDQSFQA